MDRQNWYGGELVTVENMDSIESNAHNAIALLAALLATGNGGQVGGIVYGGVGFTPTNPPSKVIQFGPASVILEDGTIVAVPANPLKTLDLTTFIGQAGVTKYIYAVAQQSSDTPVIVSNGASINYRLFDDFELDVVDVGTHPVGTSGALCVLLGKVNINANAPTITAEQIDNSVAQIFKGISREVFERLYTAWLTDANVVAIAIQGANANGTAAVSLQNTGGIQAAKIIYYTGNTTVEAALQHYDQLLARSFNMPNLGNVNGNQQLDSANATGWDMVLTGDTTISVINSIAGQELTFFIRQDGVGGHAVNWAAQFRNFSPVDGSVNSVNVIRGKVGIDGFIYGTGANSVYGAL